VVGGWWLVVGGWWLVVGGWWLVVGEEDSITICNSDASGMEAKYEYQKLQGFGNLAESD